MREKQKVGCVSVTMLPAARRRRCEAPGSALKCIVAQDEKAVLRPELSSLSRPPAAGLASPWFRDARLRGFYADASSGRGRALSF